MKKEENYGESPAIKCMGCDDLRRRLFERDRRIAQLLETLAIAEEALEQKCRKEAGV